MTLKNRIHKLEQHAEQQEPLVGGRTQAQWEQIRARLLNDPDALDRIRLEALRKDCGEEAARRLRTDIVAIVKEIGDAGT